MPNLKLFYLIKPVQCCFPCSKHLYKLHK